MKIKDPEIDLNQKVNQKSPPHGRNLIVDYQRGFPVIVVGMGCPDLILDTITQEMVRAPKC